MTKLPRACGGNKPNTLFRLLASRMKCEIICYSSSQKLTHPLCDPGSSPVLLPWPYCHFSATQMQCAPLLSAGPLHMLCQLPVHFSPPSGFRSIIITLRKLSLMSLAKCDIPFPAPSTLLGNLCHFLCHSSELFHEGGFASDFSTPIPRAAQQGLTYFIFNSSDRKEMQLNESQN